MPDLLIGCRQQSRSDPTACDPNDNRGLGSSELRRFPSQLTRTGRVTRLAALLVRLDSEWIVRKQEVV
jgi:hypothetical protein